MDIPEYYKQFQNQPPKKEEEEKKPEQKEQPSQKPAQKQGTQKPSKTPQVKDKTILYQGNGFTVNQLEDWEDKTIYTLIGPVTDGIQHNIIINVDKETEYETLEDFAEWQIKSLEEELKGCTLLKKGETKLANGTPAYEAIFSWYPTDDLRIYQHQIFAIIEKVAYKMTASFTKKTRQTIGPAIVRMMLSLNPPLK
ncbi:MAG: DcrB-related protein [Ignavibacteriota bacterium]